MSRPLIYFGSSFNPITVAHLAMLEHLIKETSKENPRPMIMLAPVFKHLFSKPALIEYEPRIDKTKEAVADLLKKLNFEGLAVYADDVIVSDIDRIVYNDVHQKNPDASSGTWTVIKYLQDHAPDFGIDPQQIRMVLGNDTYEDLVGGQWLEPINIFKACQFFYVFDRDKQPILEPLEIIQKIKNNGSAPPENLSLIEAYWLNNSAEKIIRCKGLIPSEFSGVSSTKVRELFSEAKKYLVEPVLDFILEYKLYDWAKNHTQEVKDYLAARKTQKNEPDKK